MPTNADYVTISVGGNDLGFASVITTCGLPGWLGNCNAAIDAGDAILRGALPGRLDQCVRRDPRHALRAPRVAVTGYPKLFNGTDCNPLTFFTAAEMARLNEATAELNALIEKQSEAAGFTFVSRCAAPSRARLV